MQPLLSIIVPIYNVEQYLDRCIQSILNQTYQNLEIILVDDGATDCSGVIADSYAAKDKRIKVFHKENGGLSDARNYGLDHVTGDYILFIDSDDFIVNTMCERLITVANNNNADIIITSIDIIITRYYISIVIIRYSNQSFTHCIHNKVITINE